MSLPWVVFIFRLNCGSYPTKKSFVAWSDAHVIWGSTHLVLTDDLRVLTVRLHISNMSASWVVEARFGLPFTNTSHNFQAHHPTRMVHPCKRHIIPDVTQGRHCYQHWQAFYPSCGQLRSTLSSWELIFLVVPRTMPSAPCGADTFLIWFVFCKPQEYTSIRRWPFQMLRQLLGRWKDRKDNLLSIVNYL